jgi:ribosomal protein S18 acetylase RimI-like enzyme
MRFDVHADWKATAVADKERLLAFLDTDRLYAAYAIGDLEEELFGQCDWAGAERAGRLRALGLHFRGLSPAALFLMGDPDGLRILLRSVLHPGRVYLTCRPEHLPAAGETYAWEGEPHPMWRMHLRRREIPPARTACVRLTAGDAGPVRELVALGELSGYSETQIARGVFYGIFEDGRLAALAGTHLVSPNYGVAGVGNIFTRPDRRRRGLGRAVVSAVLAELIRTGIRDIVLNVRRENAPAVHLYESLGFERYCGFLEGPASRRGPVS